MRLSDQSYLNTQAIFLQWLLQNSTSNIERGAAQNFEGAIESANSDTPTQMRLGG